jgi:tripartite-type tricarboxylate transporter receptor subunit TctC
VGYLAREIPGAMLEAMNGPCAGASPAGLPPVKVIVGFPAGTAADMAPRAVAEQMARQLGQPFVVENRPRAPAATSPPRRSPRSPTATPCSP